jgi:hypothetical protein
MGIELMTQAFHPYWADHLSIHARFLLVRMARSAKDHGDNAGQYFGGHRVLALTLTGNDDTTSMRAVRYHLSKLIKAGAITRIRQANTAGKWSTASYQLTLDNHGPHPVDN